MSKHASRHSHHGSAARSYESPIDPGAGHRHARLSRILREELSALVREELSDPRLDDVVVTYVELSVDYRNARVGFVARRDPPPARDERDRLERALAHAAPFLRSRLADTVDLKMLPSLRFVWDREAAEHPGDVDALLAGSTAPSLPPRDGE